MRYLALATDFDGTLAHNGLVDAACVAALERLLASGRRLLLVTGRELGELQAIFPKLNLFSWVVAENGAVLYRPDTRETKLLTTAPPPDFVRLLRERGVAPMSVGHVIVATWRPHENVVLDTIRDLGLEMQVIFNKDAVMVLPSGVNKASGLKAALKEMHLTPHEIVGVGDAENDHALLAMCEVGAAVDNALPALKERADLVTRGDHGAGVAELIDRMVADDLAFLTGKLTRHNLEVGADPDGKPVTLPAYGLNVLIAGPSGSGKSTAAASLLERLIAHRYQFCLIDPEGDFSNFPAAVTLGAPERAPSVDEILQMVASRQDSMVLSLVGLPLADRPLFFLGLLPRLLELRARTGRPHWLVIDEAHHLMPAAWGPGSLVLPADLSRMMLITVHPDQVAKVALNVVDTVLAVGAGPAETIGKFSAAVGEAPPMLPPLAPEAGEVLLWKRRGTGSEAVRVKLIPAEAERRRHTRKYAEGELPPESSFYFRGPEGKLNLRAQNLFLFLQLAGGVDDDTWLHHLRRGDYSQWFRERIKDKALAEEAQEIERRAGVSAAESRSLIKAAVERYYTLPASPPLPLPGTAAAKPA